MPKSIITAGIDEAGRGPGVGPVVAAAVVLPDNFLEMCSDEMQKKIFDSKKVSEKNRQLLLWQKLRETGKCENTEKNLKMMQKELRGFLSCMGRR